MDIFGFLIELANCLTMLNIEARSPGPPTWPRRHKTFLQVVSYLIAAPMLLIFLSFKGVLIVGGIYLVLVLITLLARRSKTLALGMRRCSFCERATPQDTARCTHCFCHEPVEPEASGATAGIEGWAVDVFCRAEAHGDVANKAKAMGFPVIEGGRVKVTIGPCSSQREAMKIVKAFRRTHGLEGYLIWLSATS